MVDSLNRLLGATAGLAWKKPCRAATTGANMTLSGYKTIDGVAFSSGAEGSSYNMRVLVKDQTDTTQNGVYLANSGTWTRQPDFDGNTDFVKGTGIYITNGTAYAGTIFAVTSSDPQSVGINPISFGAYVTSVVTVSAPSTSALGGAYSKAAASHQFLTALTTGGSFTAGQPSAADISGLSALAVSGGSSDLSCTTTNDSAAAGKLGEIVTSNIAIGSAVALTTTVAANVTSISLTAGDWDVFGWVGTNPAGSTTTSSANVGISTTTANVGNFPVHTLVSNSAGVAAGLPIATQRISVASTTTVYLVAQFSFATSTLGAYGYITARRAR